MSASPRLVLKSDPSRIAPLQRQTPLTIGRAPNNRLSLPRESSVSEHHAVVRFSGEQGWLICDWNSLDGTFLEGERVQHCRPLSDGDAIQLGPTGPVLLFQAAPAPARDDRRADARRPKATSPQQTSRPGATGQASSLDFNGERLSLDQILSVSVRSEPRHPHIFSWWLLVSLGSLLLLPFPLLFWVLELTGLAGWIVLGSRKDHSLVVVLRNGLAFRRGFANRPTALSHRNGIRRALGQDPDD